MVKAILSSYYQVLETRIQIKSSTTTYCCERVAGESEFYSVDLEM